MFTDGATPVTSLYFETTPAVRRGRRPSRVYTYIYVTIPRRSTGGGAHNHEASLSTASNGHRRHGAPAPPRRAAGDRFNERPLGLMRHRAQPPLLAAAERRLRAARGARIGSDRVSMHGRQPAPKAPWRPAICVAVGGRALRVASTAGPRAGVRCCRPGRAGHDGPVYHSTFLALIGNRSRLHLLLARVVRLRIEALVASRLGPPEQREPKLNHADPKGPGLLACRCLKQRSIAQ